MARRGAAIGLFPAHATDAKVSSEPGTASRSRSASNRRSQRPRRGAFRGARDPAFPRLIESRRPRERLTFPPRSVPAGQAVLQDVLRHQGAAHRRRQGTSAQTRTPRPTPRERRSRAVPLAHCRGVRLGRYSHHRYFETAASRDDRTPGASSAIAIASQRRRVVRGARTTNATGPSDVRARSC